MGVDLLCLMLVERDESVEDVVARGGVVRTTLVIGEVVLHGADGQLLLEPIDLVQEQNDRCLDKPPRVADGIEQCEGFLHTIDCLVFKQQLIVLGNGDQEQDRSNVLEAVYPLLSLGSLTTDVEHAVGKVTDDECSLGDTGCLDTRAKDILVVGNVIGSGNTVNRVKVATGQLAPRLHQEIVGRDSLLGRVVQLVLARTLEALLHADILPQNRDCVTNLRRQAVALDLCGLHEDGLDVVLGALVVERQLQRLHCLEDDAHRLDGVAEDDLLERLALIARVAALVDELHLLEDCRLAGFTSTCSVLESGVANVGTRLLTEQQHLDFVALHHLVALELVLDFLIPLLALLFLCAHSATHDGECGGWWWWWCIRVKVLVMFRREAGQCGNLGQGVNERVRVCSVDGVQAGALG